MDKTALNKWLECGALIDCGRGNVLLGFGRCHLQRFPSENSLIPSFYFPDYFLKEPNSWFIYEHYAEVNVNELINQLLELHGPFRHPITWKQLDVKAFTVEFYSLQEKFIEGELIKAVPYVFETLTLPMIPQQLIRSLHSLLTESISHSIHPYGFWNLDEGMLGGTPEVLFYMNEAQILETMACAGTIPLNHSGNIFKDPKELEEHRLVVEGITESLSSFGNVIIGERQLLKLPKLAHLVTPITVEFFKPVTWDSITCAMHPTPALGAYPKKNGASWLQSYEKKVPRRRFGAPVGYQLGNNRSCYVAIRNVQWLKNVMSIGAGCGVIATSELAKELQEIDLKIQMIKEILGLK